MEEDRSKRSSRWRMQPRTMLEPPIITRPILLDAPRCIDYSVNRGGGILLSSLVSPSSRFLSFYFSFLPLSPSFFCIRSHRTFSLSKMALAMSSERNCGHTSASRDIRHYNGGVSRVGRFFTFLLFLPSLFLFPEGGANPSSLSVPLTASLPSSR